MYIVVLGKTAASGAASEATRSLKHRRVRKKMRTTVAAQAGSEVSLGGLLQDGVIQGLLGHQLL